MPRRITVALLLLFSLSALLAQAPTDNAEERAAARWWAHVEYLASDQLEGRGTGTSGHQKAAEYAAEQFRRAGLRPAGTQGFFQPVEFISLQLNLERSSLALVRDGKAEPLHLPGDVTLSSRVRPPEHAVEAELVFVGYGLVIPELGIDDFAGLDLRGKVIVRITGTPPGLPANLAAHAQGTAERAAAMRRAGAIGMVTILPPPTGARAAAPPPERRASADTAEAPVVRRAPSREVVLLADAALDHTAGIHFMATLDGRKAESLFAGTEHSFAEVSQLMEAGEPLPRFPLATYIRAHIVAESATVRSSNVVALLPGRDRRLKHEYVVLSAHLDHLGVAQHLEGRPIYNGAMDNASGVATLLETARRMGRTRPRRSVVFLLVTAEEHGLLGSRYFMHHPTVPRQGIVANLNVDMFLPLFPLRSVVAYGVEESELALYARAVGDAMGLAVTADPDPEQNSFVRSDQYSFIRAGVPALAFRVGFERDSPEHDIHRAWRRERYHRVSDDIRQPIDFSAAAGFNEFYRRLVEAVANGEQRPRWHAESIFSRYASSADAVAPAAGAAAAQGATAAAPQP